MLRTQVASIVSPMLGEWDKVYEESRVDVGSRIDNLVFVEIHLGCPPGFFSEYFGCARSVSRVAVILGEKPRIVELPDEALFVHFMKNIRKTPRALELSTKMRTTLMLLTGDSNFVASSINDPNQMPCPDELLTRGCRDEFILENTTWTDKDGVLVIQYRTSDSWWDYECRLRVDAEQRAMRRCVSINREPECFVEHFFVPDKKTRRGCDNEADMPVELWVDESKRGFVHSVLPESYHF
ncbi:MAG: hypothetical protein FWC40_01720 [Proteobacteria bacterium]|nr:hypothetical protein [Pseudomonadota bacterium]